MVKVVIQFEKKKSTTIIGDSVADCSAKMIKEFKLDIETKTAAAKSAKA